ncbi:MAG: hypothetical protein IJ719_02075 [Clostridia bacterium]|nr:hypothetical protein [Clostridia bacterium]
MNHLDQGREERLQMDQAKERAERSLASDGDTGKRPARYKVYDRIKDNVSLRTIDIVIVITVILLVIALVYGIATGTPAQ